jgi:hypothetical protein
MISAMDFLRLCDCALSTRMGMIDRGFPAAMERLAAAGFVKKAWERVRPKYPGYQVTVAGVAHIKEHRRRPPRQVQIVEDEAA